MIMCLPPFGASAPGSLRSPSEGGVAHPNNRNRSFTPNKSVAFSGAANVTSNFVSLSHPSVGDRRLPALRAFLSSVAPRFQEAN
jgi:hypothetical protein